MTDIVIKNKDKVVRDNDGYKQDCGFRFKLKDVCSFKSEKCNSEDCDMFNIGWDKKSIEERFEREKKALMEVDEELKAMKKQNRHKEEKTTYKNLKRKKADLCIGIMYITEAFDYVQGGKMSKFVARFPRLSKKLKVRAEDLEKEQEKYLKEKEDNSEK